MKNDEHLIEEFLMLYPMDRKKIIGHYMFSDTELIMVLDDGRNALYDWMDGTVRFFQKTNSIDDENIWRLEFARRLYKKMISRCMSQHALSELTGISWITISKYMNGKSTPSLYNAEKLARALRCDINELIKFPTKG